MSYTVSFASLCVRTCILMPHDDLNPLYCIVSGDTLELSLLSLFWSWPGLPNGS